MGIFIAMLCLSLYLLWVFIVRFNDICNVIVMYNYMTITTVD